MSRPIGPKKQAAIEQRDEMRRLGLKDPEIRLALIEAGLTKQQAKELVPMAPSELPPEPPKPFIDSEMKQANLDGAINFLETIAKRINPNIIDRFPDLASVRNDSLTWARKIKSIT